MQQMFSILATSSLRLLAQKHLYSVWMIPPTRVCMYWGSYNIAQPVLRLICDTIDKVRVLLIKPLLQPPSSEYNWVGGEGQ